MKIKVLKDTPPYLKAGGIADVTNQFAKELIEKGHAEEYTDTPIPLKPLAKKTSAPPTLKNKGAAEKTTQKKKK
jgi:hypothetical protein